MMLSSRIISHVSFAVGTVIVFLLLRFIFSSRDIDRFDEYYASDDVDGNRPVGQSHLSGVDFLASVGGSAPQWLGGSSLAKQTKANEALYSELLAKRKKAIGKYRKKLEPDERTL
jgi:hypothetical protein